ncbi:MAG: alpha-mannosidase [Cyanobacterium sp. T60_A2020_053]|nr:alpha-mannosidase [Cyanobacterium sp. T60_A2020_053]
MKIQDTIAHLKSLTELDIKLDWYFTDEKLINPPTKIEQNWQKAIPNEKNYLIWSKGNKVRWFAQKIMIPHALNDYPLEGLNLRVMLTWWAHSAEVFINETKVCEGDLFDSSSRVLVANNIQPNQEYIISLRLISPSHDIGGLMVSRCLYESEYNQIDPSFVAQELNILAKYYEYFNQEEKDNLITSLNNLNWQKVNQQLAFNQELISLRNNLLNLSNTIKKRKFYLLGHAHLDMAWLWTLEETYQVGGRTFTSVLNLQKEYNQLTFGHTTAYLYQWLESHNQVLLQQIQSRVQERKWEILGGMWVEPEVNLISIESLARQLLYGQKYFLNKFGKYNKVAWLPDSFGFPAQLPQILLQGEIKYFVTGKLHWNDTNKFPYGCFWWESPDGSRIFTAMSPPNVAGVMDTNPDTMTDYSINWEKQTGLKDIFWLPGVGDHGGGPTRDMLEVVKRYDESPFFPQVNFTTAEDYLDKISSYFPEKLPVWHQDLYLELHRGCYTTHGDQKYFNRYCERLLYQAELFLSINHLLAKKYNINDDSLGSKQENIELLWQKVLLNQFHDILPGTSITEVFTDANKYWQEVIKETKKILSVCLSSITRYLAPHHSSDLGSKEIVIFNSLNWLRTELVAVNLDSIDYDIYDSEGNLLTTQVSSDKQFLFLAENIPSIGYKRFLAIPKSIQTVNNDLLNNLADFCLENDYIKAVIDSQSGNLISIYDKVNHREVIKGQGNELQLFQDQGQYWDAWNIDPNYEQFPLESPSLSKIQWLEKGNLRQVIEVVKIYHNSTFTQRYILNVNSAIIHIENKVNWQEKYTLLKVNFPLNFSSDNVNYEATGAVMSHTTNPQKAEEKAKWELCAHHWLNLTDNNYGVSLLNNCKYGYDVKPNQIRLSLLRSPNWPDAFADQGLHYFTYAIYPHQGDWKSAKTIHHGYELNTPLSVIIQDNCHEKIGDLPSALPFLTINSNHLIVIAFKESENNQNEYILRLYECEGEKTELIINNDFNLKVKNRVNFLENVVNNDDEIINPFAIASYNLITKIQ